MDAEEFAAYNAWQQWKKRAADELSQQKEYLAAQRDLEKERREEMRRIGNERTAEYMASLRDEESEQSQQEGTLGWFIKKVSAERRPLEVIRLNRNEDDAAHYLAAAYNVEVVRRGAAMQYDINTSAALSAVSRWLVSHTKPGLMLRGYIGVGKTTMMWAMRDVMRNLMGETMEIVDARSVADAGRNNSGSIASLARERLLGIDDLGTEPLVVKNYGNEVSPLVELMQQRYEHRRFTIITTNLAVTGDGDELASVYGERTYDRIKEMFNIISYDSGMKSYRQ